MIELLMHPIVNQIIVYGVILAGNMVGLRLLRLPSEHRISTNQE